MISSLEDVMQFTRALAIALPEQRSRIVVSPPGIEDKQVEELTDMLPGIPESYVACVRNVDLHRKVLGYFCLWPEEGDDEEGDLVSSLAASNLSDENPYLELMRRRSLYHVGSFESSPLFISVGAGTNGHVVVVLDPEKPEALELANNFQEFLVRAANLAQINASELGENRDKAMKEFERRLSLLAVSDVQRNAWLQIASMAIS
jgi:hypothetical protein